MDESQDIEGELCAQSAKTLSTSFAELLPGDAVDVGPFLREAAAALGETEADLARRLGVSHATLSSWKRRGAIPPPHLTWFSEEFVRHIFRTDPHRGQEGFHHPGLVIALAVFRKSDFDPYRQFFENDIRRVEICFRNVSPMSRLGLFVQRRFEVLRRSGLAEDFIWDELVPKVIELARLGATAW